MIVYGDPSYDADLCVLVARLQARVSELADAPGRVTLDALRSLLIEAGQLEQAAQDAAASVPDSETARLGGLFQAVTDGAAAAFHAHWSADAPRRDAAVQEALRSVPASLSNLGPVPNARVTVKLPEGYAFYALYPEQYAVAAQRWAADHPNDAGQAVAVIGVRSIGTSLSALVKATLEATGWRTWRGTVRPTGPPYERRAELRALTGLDGAWAVVVDEGPGQSGSSLASVAEALVKGGSDPSRISFFPGHAGEPGGAASVSAREWWARTPRYVASGGDLRWRGRALTAELAARTQALPGCSDMPVVRVEDLGGGLWRHALYGDVTEWPASCLPFERPKFRCVLADGSAVLWKYAGLAAGPGGPQSGAAFRRQQARGGWAIAPIAIAHGFVATPWTEGQPLSCRDAQDADTLAWVGRYIASVAGPPLGAEERVQAVRRLGEMLYWNVWEALGEATAERTRAWSAVAETWERERASLTYGDGHSAPHEWLRTASGRLVKTDSGGHDADHTMVGRQSVAWDIAGAIVEWGLDAATARPLLQAFQAADGAAVPDDVLTFYQLAYAAFRLGQCAMCADMLMHDAAEQARLRQAAERYATLVARLLAAPPRDGKGSLCP